MTRAPAPLDARFREQLDRLGLRGTGARVIVAVSGGADSVCLLHLFRFAADDPTLAIEAAHLDHAIRPESAKDAAWVRGLCRAWGIPLHESRAERRPRGEAGAREVRYAFLRAAQASANATHLATAHHADDQAETVLFRVLRGTGIPGLGGIPELDASGLIRPLLPFWRSEIRGYARSHRLRWRDDASNADDAFARNVVRHRILPRAERTVAPGARRALVRLAALAREDEAAWEAVLAPLLAECAREENGALLLVRERLAAYDSPLAARVLRAALRRLGIVPDGTGTRLALEFISGSPSGRTLRLPGARITTEFGVARVEREDAPVSPPPPDEPLVLAGLRGEGRIRTGGAERVARWSESAADADGAWTVRFGAGRLPLTLRALAPGDRMRTHAGTRALKKILGEARLPARVRCALPVLADSAGAVLWAPGVAAAAGLAPGPGERTITLSISDA